MIITAQFGTTFLTDLQLEFVLNTLGGTEGIMAIMPAKE